MHYREKEYKEKQHISKKENYNDHKNNLKKKRQFIYKDTLIQKLIVKNTRLVRKTVMSLIKKNNRNKMKVNRNLEKLTFFVISAYF